MFESVVVGWGGERGGEDALAWALGHPIGFRHWLTRVIDDRTAIAGDGSPISAEADAERHVRAKVAEVGRSHPGISIAGEVAVGDPMEELERRTGPGTLLVLGSDREPGSAARWRWTPATRVAARAHGPVILIPPHCRGRNGSVLVGVDGTESSRAAAFRAAELATSLRARLVVLHAWQTGGEPEVPFLSDAPADGIDVGGTVGEVDVLLRTLEHAHAELLAPIVEDVRAAYPYLQVESRLVHESAPHALLAAADDAAVVVLGRHSRWSASAALLGSVTHAMLLTSPAPVLVVGGRDAPLHADMVHLPTEEAALRSSRQVVG